MFRKKLKKQAAYIFKPTQAAKQKARDPIIAPADLKIGITPTGARQIITALSCARTYPQESECHDSGDTNRLFNRTFLFISDTVQKGKREHYTAG